ncbi:MAG: hypothetical protein ABI813_14200 [Bacteroidota bacterium]
MKKFVLLLGFFVYKTGRAQFTPVSNEDFVNAVAGRVVDSSFSHYFLYALASPCSFKKFDYDEWYKYGLKEDIPIYVLNELAKNAFRDSAPLSWQPDHLSRAVCISEQKAAEVLVAVQNRHIKHTNSKSAENSIVFYFSRPVFTNDYQYAAIDMGFRCDDRQCGMGATFLFRCIDDKWKLAGKKLVWGN